VTQIIAHRRNTISELKGTPIEYGVEMDIRSTGDRLILHHDPFVEGDEFEKWLDHYNHKTLILNVKEEGIEYCVKELVDARGITDYFFLDLSFPFLVKMVNGGERRAAIRFSEFESLETVLMLAGRCDWVWVDCFTRLPIDAESFSKLQEAGFKTCIVSPELQQHSPEQIAAYRRYLAKEGVVYDAVCTKRPDLWS